MRFGLLGPVQVWSDGGVLEVRGAVRRTLLAALLIRPGTVVSMDQLIETVWGSRAPALPTPALYNQITRLRRILGPDGARIEAVSPGYVIRVGPGELDLLEFEGLCADGRRAGLGGRWEDASKAFAAALSLWRGRPLADVPELEAHSMVQHLEESRHLAIQGRTEAELNLGRHDGVIGELRTLVAEYPLREAFQSQLMLALHRAGRQGEALSVYATLRQKMVDELGEDPSASTRELHQRILRSDPTLMPGAAVVEVAVAATHTAVRQLPADTRIFAGRSTELDRLVELADGSDPGMVVISAINGMGGVGKTALAVRAAHRLAVRYPDGQLFIDLHGYSADLDPVAPEDALGYLLRSLGVPQQAIPRDVDGRAALYRSKLAETRTLIVLDNAVNAAQVRPLLPAAQGCLVLVTSRSQLASLDDAHQLALDVLPGADAEALLHEVAGSGRVTGPEAAELAKLCGHMPLAIRIVAARMRHRSALTARALIEELREERGRLDRLRDDERDLETVFDCSLRVLPEDERRLFCLLGVVPGPDFDAYATAHVLGVEELRPAERMLESLLDCNLLIQHTPGRYRFHDLLRVYASNLAAKNEDAPAALNRLLDYYTATASAAESTLPKRSSQIEPSALRIVEPALKFEDRAQSLAWFQVERESLRAIAEQLDIDPARHVALTFALSAFLYREGLWNVSASLLATVIGISRDRSDRLAEAHALRALGIIHADFGEKHIAIAYLERALVICRDLGDRPGELLALCALGNVYYSKGEIPRAVEISTEALAISEQIGDRGATASMLGRLALQQCIAGRNVEARELYQRAMTIQADLGDHAGHAFSVLMYTRTCYALGDFAPIRAMLDQSLALSRMAANRLSAAHALQEIARQELLAGDYDSAIPLLEAALETFLEIGYRVSEANVYWELGRIEFARGDAEGALRKYELALSISIEIGSNFIIAQATHEIGRVRHALGDVDTAAAKFKEALSIYDGMPYPVGRAEVLNSVAALTVDAEGPEAGLVVFRETLDVARSAEHPLEVAHALAGMARCEIRLEQRASGLEHLREAVDLYRRMGSVEYAAAAAFLRESS